MNALVSGGVGHVFLKQFRDSAVPTMPCYQAVCKTDTVPGKFRGGARVKPDAYRISIGNYASNVCSATSERKSRRRARDHAGFSRTGWTSTSS